ncbi:Integrase zinc binding domain [Popillia japonica]|uniref:Integrase zinc binding domain n=1 Tax=Popillia japonica TaxID=7064 RepID=A0AAW1MBZ7_POPJA
MTILVKIVQKQEFGKDILHIKKHGNVKTDSNILSLNRFLDKNDILRVGGRLTAATIHYDRKHQILLPSKHPLTDLIINDEQLHSGIQGTIAIIRTKYWPISVKNNVKPLIKSCVTCFKAKPTSTTPLMGNLPVERIMCHVL